MAKNKIYDIEAIKEEIEGKNIRKNNLCITKRFN